MILKKFLFFTLLIASILSCSKSDDEPTGEIIPEVPSNSITPEFRNEYIATNKACYSPGEQVQFTLTSEGIPSIFKARYKHLNSVVAENELSSNTWTWTPPNNDFRGYVAEVYTTTGEKETIYATIGIDVSSDWKKFPRYGFLSDFSNIGDDQINAIIENLNRYHINGIQFYDWHNKHHKPLPLENSTPAESWKDIINKDVFFSTVEKYITAAHTYNMKTMYYNLIYGAWEDAQADGVQKDWYVFKDDSHANKDYHPLDSPPFLSNLYLLDPSNTEWQEYINNENKIIYEHLDFDGFHMDQLGNRGNRYNYDGIRLDLSETFEPFINSVKTEIPNKYIVMNAVNQYGQQNIASAPSDFLYTEVWSPNDKYSDLARIIKQNNIYGNEVKNTVLAAYVNYKLADSKGYFNNASVLLTNSVIFAFGGAHLELGEHMLGKEYFPNNNLEMNEELEKSLTGYYDFLVGYQNLLREGGTFNTVSLGSLDGKLSLSNWPGQAGDVATIAKQIGNMQVIHLINFADATTMEWRDNDGVQTIPSLVKNAELVLNSDKPVKGIWVASPDIIGGASRKLNFKQEGSNVSFLLPELKYWTMIVVEHE